MPDPILENDCASEIRRSKNGIPATSTSGERYSYAGKTSIRIHEMNKTLAGIAESAVGTTSYTSGAGRCMKAGENRYVDNRGSEIGVLKPVGEYLRQARGADPPCGYKNRDAKDQSNHSSDNTVAGKPLAFCKAFQYVAGVR
jgi:hypothetical protein